MPEVVSLSRKSSMASHQANQHPRFNAYYDTCHRPLHSVSSANTCFAVEYFELQGEHFEDLWKILSDFATVQKYQPLVETVTMSGSGVGSSRVLSLYPPATPLEGIRETLILANKEKGVISWSMDETKGFPFEKGTTVLSIHNLVPKNKSSKKMTLLIWSCSFEPLSPEEKVNAKNQMVNYIQISGGSLKTLLW